MSVILIKLVLHAIILPVFRLFVFPNWTKYFSWSLVFMLCSFWLIGKRSLSCSCFIPSLANFKHNGCLLIESDSRFNIISASSYVVYFSLRTNFANDFVSSLSYLYFLEWEKSAKPHMIVRAHSCKTVSRGGPSLKL